MFLTVLFHSVKSFFSIFSNWVHWEEKNLEIFYPQKKNKQKKKNLFAFSIMTTKVVRVLDRNFDTIPKS